jgi:dolichol-phosphate mannosyltransferase
VIVGLGILGGVLLLYLRFFTRFSVPGITAAILTVILIGGVQIIMLGIIGEYIGRIFEEVKHRPLYLVENMKNINLSACGAGKDSNRNGS